jgi:hypothetical protein
MRPLWVGGLIAPLFAPVVFFLAVMLWSGATNGVPLGTHSREAGVASAVIFVLPMSYLATWLLGLPCLYWLQRKSQLSTLRVCTMAIVFGVIATWILQFIGRIGPLNGTLLLHGALIGGCLALCVGLPLCWIVGVER